MDSAPNGTPRRSRNIPFACPPPRLPATTMGMRLADRVLPTGAGQCIFFAAVAVGVIVARSLPIRAGLAIDVVVTFAASGWCLINFWRCREAHCVVNGYGWAALGMLEVVELALGRSLIMGAEGLVFIAILVAALVFECAWQARSGTNALIRPAHTR
jgi:hypothetical protein